MKNFNFKTKDKTEEYSKIAKDYAKEIAKHKGVIGITIGRGITQLPYLL